MQVKTIAEKHSAILSTSTKLPPDFKTFVLSIFETGLTVTEICTIQTLLCSSWMEDFMGQQLVINSNSNQKSPWLIPEQH